jgi:hypothetical protein
VFSGTSAAAPDNTKGTQSGFYISIPCHAGKAIAGGGTFLPAPVSVRAAARQASGPAFGLGHFERALRAFATVG